MKKSSGILLFRRRGKFSEAFIVHPGGPFWANKDEGAWSIPKGEFSEGESTLQAAIREFNEETGFNAEGDFIALKPIRQKSGKIIYCFALESDFDASHLISNTFKMEWPPKSGQIKEFYEIDRGGWFSFDECKQKLNTAQQAFIIELESLLKN